MRWPRPRAGMVVSEQPLATDAGAAMLEQGGNAVDAAVATALALAVVHPQAGNLGGGGFALWVPHDPRANARVLDFRERAPQAISAELFQRDGGLDAQIARRSALSSGVPGSPAGLYLLQHELGKLDFGTVAEPALRLAREGFAVDPFLAALLRERSTREKLSADADALSLFYPDGDALAEGALLRQPALARTLERLVESGPDAFYRGELAESLVASLAARGGVLASADLASYAPVWREPLRGWFRGYEILTMPPPSSGGIVLLHVLALLDGFPLDAERESSLARRAALAPLNGARVERASTPAEADLAAGLSARALHWWVEALRGAFADRAEHLGDPDFVDVPVSELLAPQWVARRRVEIGEHARSDVRAWVAPPREAGNQTTHISVLDAQGNALSLTTTLNENFGSGLYAAQAGFLWNNELDDFALQAGQPNAYGLVGGDANALEPLKRPLSSMTPTIVRENGNTVALVIGSRGGPRIITAVVQVLLRTLVYGQSLEAAVAAPRLHQQWSPSATALEPGFDTSLQAGLRDRGHELKLEDERWGCVQAIRVPMGGEPEGVSDARGGGSARRVEPRKR